MSKMYEKLQKCVSIIREKTDFVPEVALILGSGLGEYARNMDVKAEVPYSEIEGFPVSTVAGHDGRFLFGYVEKVPMVIMKGRVHYYEGYDMDGCGDADPDHGNAGGEKSDSDECGRRCESGFPAGGSDDDYGSYFDVSCRVRFGGRIMDELGTRFPDMSHVYDSGALRGDPEGGEEAECTFERGNLCSVLGAEL